MNFLKREVYLRRHESIRAFLEKEGYEAYIVLTPDNFYYVTGFHLDVAPWERPVAAVIPKNGKPFMVMNELSTNHVRLAKGRGTLAVDDVYFWQEHVSTVFRGYTKLQWTELLAYQLKQRGIDRGTLAFDSGTASVKPLLNVLPKLNLVTEANLMVEMRTVKCPEELEIYRVGAQLTDYAQEVFRDLVKPGAYIAEIDREVAKQMVIKAAKLFPGDSFVPWCLSLSGPYSCSPHGTGGDIDMTVEVGHVIVDMLCCSFCGYSIENERTWIVGEPTDIQARAFEAAEKACIAAAEKMVAGNPVWSIDAAAQAVIEEAGFGQYIRHRTGHGLGIAGHEFPEDVAFNNRPLIEGEVWSAEPGIYIFEVGGFRHDDTVIVGKTAPEIVTKWPKNLKDQTIKV
jgi:Xaa-Pro aminopeptidase